jgi:hypothetical protein
MLQDAGPRFCLARKSRAGERGIEKNSVLIDHVCFLPRNKWVVRASLRQSETTIASKWQTDKGYAPAPGHCPTTWSRRRPKLDSRRRSRTSYPRDGKAVKGGRSWKSAGKITHLIDAVA